MSHDTDPTGDATASHRILGGRIHAATASELYDHWVHGCGSGTDDQVDAALRSAIAELQAARVTLWREAEALASARLVVDPRDATGGAE